MVEVINESGNLMVVILIICIAKIVEISMTKIIEAQRRRKLMDAALDYANGYISREEYNKRMKEIGA